jgi:hypothetical protein
MDARQEPHAAHLELGDLYSVDWYGVHTDEKNTAGIDDEIFQECVVCQYWSERIEEAWRQRQNALSKAHCLQRLLKEHQKRGACARRLPTILTDLKHVTHAFALTH